VDDLGDVTAFFQRYAAAFDAGNAAAIAAFYHVPCLLIRSGSAVAFPSADALASNLRALVALYASQGYARARFAEPSTVFLDRDLALVTIAWTIELRDGGTQSFRNTYELCELDGRWGIVVSTQHGSGGIAAGVPTPE
jgi:hypothetical protein